MPYSRRSRYSSRSSSPCHSESVSRSRSRSRSLSPDAENPGNNLYVTGLPSRATKRDIEKHFSHEGEVVDVHLVVDPWTKESRGFGFVTMASVEDANRCLKYLDRSVLEGRVITVEKAKRGRGRTPTPGRYLGSRSAYECRRSPSYSYYRRDRYDSPGYSDIDLQRRSYSRSRSPYDLHDRSPDRRHRQRSYSPADSRYWLPHGRSMSPYHRRLHARSISPRHRRSKRSYSRSVSLSRSRSYSRSISPVSRRRSRRSYSRSYSPRPRKRSLDRSRSSRRSRRYSRESYSHSRSRGLSSYSPSISRSRSP